MLKRILNILFVILLGQSFLPAQSCYIQLDDASGFDTSPYLSELESAACALRDAFPVEFQNDFAVYDFGFYLHQNDYSEGVPQIYLDKIAEVASLTPYYFLIGRNTNTNSGDKNTWISVKLPITGYFSCYELGDIGMIVSRWERSFNPTDPANSIIQPIIELSEMINKWSDCCVAGRSLMDNSCSTGECMYDQTYFDEYLESEGFIQFSNQTEIGVYTSFPKVTVYSEHKIVGHNNLSFDIQQFIDESGNNNLQGYIIDRTAFCEGKYFENQGYDGNALFIIIDNETNGYNLLIAGCGGWVNPLNIGSPVSLAPNAEELQELSLVYALYKKNYPNRPDFLAKTFAIYHVCYSSPAHWVLTGLGFVCDFCDLIDVGLYVLEGNFSEASLSLVAAIPLVGSAGKVGLRVVAASGKKALLVFNKHGLRYFGQSTQLATIIGKQSGKAAHHIIPWQLFNEFKDPAIQKLVEKGFHPNHADNGKHLLRKIKGKDWAGEVVESTFHGNHPAYTRFVRESLEDIHEKHNGNADLILNEVTSTLIPKLKNLITEAEQAIKNKPAWAGKTLNDYFKPPPQ